MIEMLKNRGDFDKKPNTPILSANEMLLFKCWLLQEHTNLEHDLLVSRYEVKTGHERFARLREQDGRGEEDEEFFESYVWLCVRIIRLEHELRQVQPVYETVAEGIEEDIVQVDMNQPLAKMLWEKWTSPGNVDTQLSKVCS